MKSKLLLVLIMVMLDRFSFSQSYYQLEWEYHYTGFVSPMSLNPDNTGRPYLYAASNEQGLKIFDLSGNLLNTIDTIALQESVTNFTQVGTLLYVCIGHEANGDLPGLAIIDVSNVMSPVIKDIWVHPAVSPADGAGIVRVEGNYAYLGAMRLGLDILDISDPTNIVFKSEFKPVITYPVSGPPASMFNARGMEVKNGVVYLCYDNGGLRVINCSNVLFPVETGRYANPITYSSGDHPRAYNNVILNDSVAYVAVDYCGLEVLKINDTSNISLLDSFNPNNCPTGDWHMSPIHTNELAFDAACEELFMSAGKSEMISMDVSDPTNIDSTGMYGSLTDTTATWGIGMRNDSIFLSYITIPFYISWFHPFDAKWNGIKMIRWLNPCVPSSVENITEEKAGFKNQPNPFSDRTEIFFRINEPGDAHVQVIDANGTTVAEMDHATSRSGEIHLTWDGKDRKGADLPNGLYILKYITRDGELYTAKMMKQK